MKNCSLIRDHEDMIQAGELVARSEMFGSINPAAGYMIVSICHDEHMSLLEFAETYNWMHNSAHMKADAMLARFVDRGGTYIVEDRTPERAAITVRKDSHEMRFEITWDDVKAEPFTQDRNGKTKANYATARKRMQSLWSRVISDAVHTFDPQSCKGAYPAEEAETFANDDDVPVERRKVVPVRLSDEHAARVGVAEAETEPEIDYTVCPALGSAHDGKPWAEFGTEALQRAVASDRSKYPAITDTHMAEIKLVLRERAKKAAEGGGE